MAVVHQGSGVGGVVRGEVAPKSSPRRVRLPDRPQRSPVPKNSLPPEAHRPRRWLIPSGFSVPPPPSRLGGALETYGVTEHSHGVEVMEVDADMMELAKGQVDGVGRRVLVDG